MPGNCIKSSVLQYDIFAIISKYAFVNCKIKQYSTEPNLHALFRWAAKFQTGTGIVLVWVQTSTIKAAHFK